MAFIITFLDYVVYCNVILIFITHLTVFNTDLFK